MRWKNIFFYNIPIVFKNIFLSIIIISIDRNKIFPLVFVDYLITSLIIQNNKQLVFFLIINNYF